MKENKLEGVVQKRIARIIVITYGLSRLKTLSAALHSRKVLRYHRLAITDVDVSQSLNHPWQIDD